MMLFLDASCLIAFYSNNEMDSPFLLHKLVDCGYELVVPKKVYEEIDKGKKNTINILNNAIKTGVIRVDPNGSNEQVNKLKNRFPKLDDGEIQVIFLGDISKKNNDKYRCVIDEGPGRNIAKRMGLCLIGTLGILKLLSEHDVLNEEKRQILYKRLQKSNFRLNSKVAL